MSVAQSNWTTAEGEGVFTLVRGVSYDKSEARSSGGKGLVPVLRANNIANGRVVADDLVYVPSRFVSDEQYLRCGDILIAASSGSKRVVGKAAQAEQSHAAFAFGAFCTVARPARPELSDWLAAFTRSRAYRQFVEGVALGININNLRGSDLKRMPVPLAPSAEQRRIVAKIDSLSGKSKRAREKLDHIPRLVEKYKQAVLAAAFAKFRARVDVEPLQQCTEFVTSGSRGWAKYYSEGGAFYIRVGNVGRGDISLLRDDVQHVSPPAGAEGQRTLVQPGDIVVTITADLGRVGIVPEDLGEAYVNQHVALVRLKNIRNAAFVSWYLTSEYGQEQLLEKNRGATKAGLGLDDIRAVRVPLPPSHVQEETILRIEHAFAWIDRLAAEATSARKLIDHLDQAILAKAFRGELVPQDPNDESASVLLERIKAERSVALTKKKSQTRK